MLQALSATPAVPLARPTASNAPEIMKLLDAGAYGVICPQVDTPEIAAHVVAACRYPPTGMRSSGAARALLYGGDDYVTHANAEVLVLAMIESRQALERLDEILDTRGLDGLFIGPYDLSMSLGEAAPPAQSPRVEDAIARVLAAGRQRGLLCGIFCPSVDVAVQRAAQGFHLVTPMNDAGALRAAYASACARLGPTG
jgi:4-hydroxy-2-oxoheptanedioate aldolase